MNSSLFSNIVVHERYLPFSNRFSYKVLSLYIDYEELGFLSKKYKLFSYNKFNFFSFNEIDHGFRDGRLLKEYVSFNLKKNKINYNNLKIKILCFPRILGYVFNPLSVIYCFDNQRLIGIFYEVKNTPNEQHTYLFASNQNVTKIIFKHFCKKIFYVSPFINMDCKYNFFTKIPNQTTSVIIEVLDRSKNKILIASQIGKKINFSSFSMFKSILKNPFIMYKVMFFILYQSIVIKFKGGMYYARNKKTKDTTSFEGSF